MKPISEMSAQEFQDFANSVCETLKKNSKILTDARFFQDNDFVYDLKNGTKVAKEIIEDDDFIYDLTDYTMLEKNK